MSTTKECLQSVAAMIEILPDKSATSARAFQEKPIEKTPFKIRIILTDNGKEFTDCFAASGERKPTGSYPFLSV